MMRFGWQDAFVLCRIFQKSGSGPKNGEKYGAPFIEEEWEDDESIFVPKQEDYAEELPVDKDSYLDANDIEQVYILCTIYFIFWLMSLYY